jgi:sulfatase modifying factor 1
MTNCGMSSENCCTSQEVPGGTFYRTYTNSGGGPTGEADPATVSNFRLDKYLVTVGRFRQFVAFWNQGVGYLPAAGSGKHTHLNGGQGLVNVGVDAGTMYEPGWAVLDYSKVEPTDSNLACDLGATWTPSAGSNENVPITCVNWYEAYAFCMWDGGFLPSEAEWEFAAAGGNQQREYPWGSTALGTSNQYAIYACNYPNGPGDAGNGLCSGVAITAPVGTATLGVGVWGQLDLSGDAWEWNLDAEDAYVDPCADCADLSTTGSRVVRGGGAGTDAESLVSLLSSSRASLAAIGRNPGQGLRCARSP